MEEQIIKEMKEGLRNIEGEYRQSLQNLTIAKEKEREFRNSQNYDLKKHKLILLQIEKIESSLSNLSAIIHKMHELI